MARSLKSCSLARSTIDAPFGLVALVTLEGIKEDFFVFSKCFSSNWLEQRSGMPSGVGIYHRHSEAALVFPSISITEQSACHGILKPQHRHFLVTLYRSKSQMHFTFTFLPRNVFKAPQKECSEPALDGEAIASRPRNPTVIWKLRAGLMA
jgi:hypothetical protein